VVNELHQRKKWKLGGLGQGGCPKLVIKLGTKDDEDECMISKSKKKLKGCLNLKTC